MELKDRLKEFRQHLGMNQTDFAAALGLQQRTYSSYENGTNRIPEFLVKSICLTYSISEDWLRDGVGEMYPVLDEDEVLADRVGSVLAPDADPEMKRLVAEIFDLLDMIPQEYHGDIADALELIVSRRRKP